MRHRKFEQTPDVSWRLFMNEMEKRIRESHTETLLKMVQQTRDEYTPGAIAIAENELRKRDVAFENENTKSVADTGKANSEAGDAKSFSPIKASVKTNTLYLNPRQPPVINQSISPPSKHVTSQPDSPESQPAISQQSTPASKVMVPRMAKTYPNLISAGEMQAAYGRFVKGIGIAIGVIGAIAGLIAADKGGIGDAFVVWGLALPIALIIHVIGTFVAAAGEAMQALADIATNSWPK
jgi:hypothetical protein